MKEVPFVDLRAQIRSIERELEDGIQGVLSRGDFVLGRDVAAFEEEFAAYCGVEHAVGVASGTDALHLALLACGVGPGDEVITAAHSFVATAAAIAFAGARPVFADVDPRTYNLDPAAVERAITPRTKALLPVHLYGHPAEMDALIAIARARGLRVVEDACQAHGAEWKGRRVGGIGDVGAFSFYPSKNLGAFGDGGAATTRDPEIAQRLRMLRNYGQREKHRHEILGFNSRLDTLQAAVLRVKLRHLDRWNERRREVAALYDRRLAGSGVTTPGASPEARHVFHLYVVRSPRRDELRRHLNARGIAALLHYPVPIHLQPAFRELGGREGDFPHAEAACREAISLPLYPEITEEQIDRVVEAVAEFGK